MSCAAIEKCMLSIGTVGQCRWNGKICFNGEVANRHLADLFKKITYSMKEGFCKFVFKLYLTRSFILLIGTLF